MLVLQSKMKADHPMKLQAMRASENQQQVNAHPLFDLMSLSQPQLHCNVFEEPGLLALACPRRLPIGVQC